MAAIIEQHHDDNGIIWPMAVAPYHVIICLLNKDDEAQNALAESVYEELLENRVEVLLDDRKERPGVKFKDADLLGIPIRITVGKKAVEGKVEYKLRNEAENEEMSATGAVAKAIKKVKSEI